MVVSMKNKNTNVAKAWTVAEVEKAAVTFAKGFARDKKLVQDATIGALAHAAEHGNYTVILPLADAIYHASKTMFQAWAGWVQAHSRCRLDTKALQSKERGQAMAMTKSKETGAYVGGMAEVWSYDKALSQDDAKAMLIKAQEPRPVGRADKNGNKSTVPNLWNTYKAPPKPRDETALVNIPDMIKRFERALQTAIDNGTAAQMQDGALKPMTFHQIKVMVDKIGDNLTAPKSVQPVKEPATIEGKAEPKGKSVRSTAVVKQAA